MTLLIAGISATIERDLKKIVALSTLRQLGVILFALSNQMPNICFFHLITHAFFKATIFLCVGTLIFTRGGIQDYRLSGGC
jgi:NADH:ubiquinone oxidoreductase subunit 5 (subunit L)/multisubunit Na+/H+ antiporter MnhA subunit